MTREHLNESAQVLVAELSAALPDWARFLVDYGPQDDPQAAPGSIQLTVLPPAHPGHTLRVLLRGNTVEVVYDDARPPGPAEQVFAFNRPHVRDAARAVVAFVQEVIAERVVVVREPLGWVTRLLRGRQLKDVPWFRRREEVQAAAANRYPVVYSWRGTYSRPPVHGAA